jgi:hypothetical protein
MVVLRPAIIVSVDDLSNDHAVSWQEIAYPRKEKRDRCRDKRRLSRSSTTCAVALTAGDVGVSNSWVIGPNEIREICSFCVAQEKPGRYAGRILLQQVCAPLVFA